MAQLAKTVNGLAIASVKTLQGLAIASAKTIMGVDNTAGGGSGLSLTVLASGSSTSDPQDTASISPTASHTLIAVVAVSVVGGGSTDDTTSEILPTGPTGVTWTYQAHIRYGSRRAIYLFTGAANGSPSSGAVNFNFTASSGGTFEEFKWSVIQLSGENTGTPVSNVTEAAGSGTTGSLTIGGTVDAGDFTLIAVAQENAENMTEEAGLTVLTEITTGTGIRALMVAYDSAAAIDQSPSITWPSSGSWGAVGCIVEVA